MSQTCGAQYQDLYLALPEELNEVCTRKTADGNQFENCVSCPFVFIALQMFLLF